MVAPIIGAGPRTSTVWAEGDPSYFVWAFGWVAHAISHFGNPFYSPYLNAPRGVNLLANADAVGFAILLTPVTWVLGPTAAYNVALGITPVLSALGMLVLLRQWKVRWPVAVGGAALWAFSPFAMGALEYGWLQVAYLATPPLLAYVLCDVFVFRRHSPRFNGLLAAAVCFVQFLVGSETLAICAFGTAAALVVLAVRWAARRSRPSIDAGALGRFALWWAVPAVVVIAAPALYALGGPAHYGAWIWPRATLESYHITWQSLTSVGTQGTFLYPYYRVAQSDSFGVILLLAAVASLVVVRRHAFALTAAVVGVIGLWLARGAYAFGHPDSLIWKVPAIRNVIVDRFIVLTWFAVIVVVSLAADRLLAVTSRWRWTPVVVGAAAVAVLVQPLYTVGTSLPLDADHLSSSAVLASLPPGRDVVLDYPYPLNAAAMIQQASQGFHYELLSGWGSSEGSETPREATVIAWFTRLAGPLLVVDTPTRTLLDEVRAQLAQWRTTLIVTPLRYVRDQQNRIIAQPARFIAAMTQLYGTPQREHGEFVWTPATAHAPPIVLDQQTWAACTALKRTPGRIPACVEHTVTVTPSPGPISPPAPVS